MAEVVWTEPALLGIDGIAEYIALENIDAARALVHKIFFAIERLEAHPQSGRTPEEMSGSRYREIIVGPCRIFYRPSKNKVFILYVVRSERQLRKYILADRSVSDS